ncbi:response regulator transcription factor [Thioalkalivibrio sp. XN279]|uniref:response regulator n=1 Tax=Thioalkalivibrio sp. XN279 TaxID=2714953 RepID=UPI00140DBE33|nr:response regulator transcription factor [Thioalkalivibrio sp. XN279]NHA13901.1 response regulator transcription factor [Thioalkalivibrio sp. XN279]
MGDNARIIVADDHPLFREALQQALAPTMPGVSFVEAESFESLQAAVESCEDPDLVLLDLEMPGAQGFSVLTWLRSQHPALPVVLVSATSDAAVMRRAVDLGAAGFIPKSSTVDTISEAISAVLEGEIWLPEAALALDDAQLSEDKELARKVASLTPQQFRVLDMLADGLLNKQIAAELEVSEATVKAHVTAIFRKLGVRSRTQAAVAARRIESTTRPHA